MTPTMKRAPARSRQLTLSEHFFWTIVTSVAVCLALAIVLFVAA